MKVNYTHIVYLLDRSGSMSAVQDDIAGGFDSFIEQQRTLPQECTMSLIQFDNEYDEQFRFLNIKLVKSLDFKPRGSTALYDAIGKCILTTGKELAAMPVFVRPSKVLFIVHTDGEENSSREFNKAQIKEMIVHQEQKYSWKFVFIGTNFDVMGEAQSLDIHTKNTMAYTNNTNGITNCYASLSRGVSNLRNVTHDVYWETTVFGESEGKS